VEVDDVAADRWEARPWPHNVLLTVDEHGQGALTRVYKKAVATAEAGGRVVMVVQEAPREGEQKSFRAFGHAAGWANATESAGSATPPRLTDEPPARQSAPLCAEEG